MYEVPTNKQWYDIPATTSDNTGSYSEDVIAEVETMSTFAFIVALWSLFWIVVITTFDLHQFMISFPLYCIRGTSRTSTSRQSSSSLAQHSLHRCCTKQTTRITSMTSFTTTMRRRYIQFRAGTMDFNISVVPEQYRLSDSDIVRIGSLGINNCRTQRKPIFTPGMRQSRNVELGHCRALMVCNR